MLHCVDIANFAEVGDHVVVVFQRCVHLANFDVGAGVDASTFGEVASTYQTNMFHCIDQTNFEVDRGIVLQRGVHLTDFGVMGVILTSWKVVRRYYLNQNNF